ncbi:MAG TPA: AMP-binding protein [Gemmatimonadales bacterium]
MSQPAPPELLHEHFARQRAHTPRQAALRDGDRSITYEELGTLADRLAGGLVERGIGPGSMVGLHVERGIEWVACVLAILKANAAVVPLPPSYPATRLREILQYAELDGIIEHGASALDPSAPGRRLSLEGLCASASPAAVPGGGRPDQPAFVLCSSGSTGQPKMIVRSHQSFFHRLRWTWNAHPFQEGECCCQKSHMTTTHAIYELFEPLLRGVPVVVIPDQEVRNLERFWDVIRAHTISRLLVVPSQLQASLALPGFVPPPVRVLVLMGEYVNPVLAGQTLAAFPEQTRIYSIYGSTEASSTLVCDLREWFRPAEELPLGRPIDPAVRPVVLATTREPTPPGQVGRLYMGGPSLFSGYFRDPALTASVLVRVPSLDAPVYDTGDEVRLTSAGQLEFVGRADQTIKVRGYRVDLREVERALLLHADVQQAAVVGSGSGAGAERLLAFVAPASVDRSSVYQALRDRLPEYMVPSVLVGLDALPLTASGKADRRRLLSEYAEQAAASRVHRELSGTERRVAAVWDRILEDGGHAPDVSFFEAGGTSLSVFSLVHRLREEFGVDREALDAQTVYRAPSIEALAAHIDRVRAGGAAAPAATPILVTLRQGKDPSRSPVFFIASAGGALGSYQKLARALSTPREVIGVRDPFTWGERDPLQGFDRWVDQYLRAIRARQPAGPYYVGAYSSGGAFAYEVAQRLRQAGAEVALLVLIDPIGLDTRTRWRYGWWAHRSIYAKPHVRALTRLAGRLRRPPTGPSPTLASPGGAHAQDLPPSEAREVMEEARLDRNHMLAFSALLELNTGIRYTIEPSAFDGVPPEGWLGVLQEHVRTVTPEVEAESIERILVQYPLQFRVQNCYRVRPYDGQVFLVEPVTWYTGLLRAQLRPYVRHLQATVLDVGEPTERQRELAGRFGALGTHYRSMRDDRFVGALARELDARLG